ncbi:MAG: PilZ domain-containing protein [Candidatus Acidiferrum sp.]
MTQHKRRSGRIAKEIPVVLLGTSATGKVFSEETKTVVLSRHGAGIVSGYAFAPDEVLTLRLPGSSKEAEIRLIGQMGGEPGRHVYGVAFVDPELEFWPMEFPPPEPDEPARHAMALECSFCQSRLSVEPSDIEEDVYKVNGNVLRYCEQCGSSTPWKLAVGAAAAAAPVRTPEASTNSVRGNFFSAKQPAPKSTLAPSLSVSLLTGPSSDSREATRPPTQADFEPAYSGSFDHEIATTASVLEPEPFAAPSTAPAEWTVQPAAQPTDASGRRVNRRQHLRIRVSFNACVRHPAHADEIVECENVSKGGLCFHSCRQYAVESLIEIAAPYSPGEAALFVPAQIRRVEALSGGQVFRYGIAYTKLAVPGSSF